MARKLTAEEMERYKTDFDPPTIQPPKTEEERRTGTGKGNHSATGRPPSADPKKNYITFKMTDGEKAELEETADLLNMKKSRVLIEGLHLMTEKAQAEAWRRTKKEFEAHQIRKDTKA